MGYIGQVVKQPELYPRGRHIADKADIFATFAQQLGGTHGNQGGAIGIARFHGPCGHWLASFRE